MLACQGSEIIGIGEFGRPIDGVRDQSNLPRLLFTLAQDDEDCATVAGPCTSICDQKAPGECEATACVPLLIDSGSPVTVLPKAEFELRDRCIAVRQGHLRQGVAEASPSPAGTVTRFRFENVPTVDAPSIKAGGWEWDAGVFPDPGRIDIGAVLGANLLKHFAVRLTALDEERFVTFYEQFPGNERALADQGFAFLRLQYPNRLLGSRPNDVCAFGEGLACEVDDLALFDQSDDLTFEASRMMLDACIGPPPCAPLWEQQSSNGNKTCGLRPGHSETVEDSKRNCTPPTDSVNGGLGASFVVATGVPGVVLFEDSARRMFGAFEELPSCNSATAPAAGQRACLVDEPVELFVPGYPPQRDLRQLRVRSLAFVAGETQPSASAPCERLERRLEASELSCRGLDALARPHAPDVGGTIAPDDHALVLGENYWSVGQREADPDRWLATTVLSASSTVTMNIRREVGTDAAEPDGLIGSALLSNTDVVLDYTENADDEKPGVRVACLKTGDPACLSFPACSSSDSKLGESAPGRTACCWGMPDALVRDVLTREDHNAEACCQTLSAGALADVQGQGSCLDVPPPAGIGGIIP
jgi:hypothetical protein